MTSRPKGIDTLAEDIVFLYEEYTRDLRDTRTTQFSSPTLGGFMAYLRFGCIDRNEHD